MPVSRLHLVTSALAVLLFTGCTSTWKPSPAPVASVDLNRYMGRWYVISHVPYFLEKSKVASYDTYARRPDGKLTNNFTFRKKAVDAPEQTWEGVARVIDPASNAVWKVSFVWPLAVTYKVLALDPAYQWAVVGNDDGSLLWVLSRERHLPSATYTAILADLSARGLPAAQLVLVPQPEA